MRSRRLNNVTFWWFWFCKNLLLRLSTCIKNIQFRLVHQYTVQVSKILYALFPYSQVIIIWLFICTTECCFSFIWNISIFFVDCMVFTLFGCNNLSFKKDKSEIKFHNNGMEGFTNGETFIFWFKHRNIDLIGCYMFFTSTREFSL